MAQRVPFRGLTVYALTKSALLAFTQGLARELGPLDITVNLFHPGPIAMRGAIHIQNVNAWHSRFKSWLVRFRGVASRYLVNYSGWQRLLDEQRLCTPMQWLRAAILVN